MAPHQLPRLPIQNFCLLLIGEIDNEIERLWNFLIDRGYQVEHLPGINSFETFAIPPHVDLILLSDQCEQNSFEICHWLSTAPQLATIPIIFLCVNPSSLNRPKIFQAGAADYLFAPFVPEETFTRIEHHLSVADLRRQLELKEKELEQRISDFQVVESSLIRINQQLAEVSKLDLTTELSNYQYFEQSLIEEWRKSTRARILWGDSYQTTLSVIIVIIDGFREYIQYQGEEQAEDCLRVVGHLLKQSVRRSGDLVARYNEIAISVLLPNTPQEGALRVTEIIREAVHQAHLPHPLQSHLTLSLGVISAIPNQAQSTNVVLQAINELLGNSLQEGFEQLVCDSL
jgi:diguanylate cyclase (GGDEF)-like protein